MVIFIPRLLMIVVTICPSYARGIAEPPLHRAEKECAHQITAPHAKKTSGSSTLGTVKPSKRVVKTKLVEFVGSSPKWNDLDLLPKS